MPKSKLTQIMSYSELLEYIEYANTHGMPYKRLELLISRLTAYFVQANSKNKVKLNDFILSDDFTSREELQSVDFDFTKLPIKKIDYSFINNRRNK